MCNSFFTYLPLLDYRLFSWISVLKLLLIFICKSFYRNRLEGFSVERVGLKSMDGQIGDELWIRSDGQWAKERG